MAKQGGSPKAKQGGSPKAKQVKENLHPRRDPNKWKSAKTRKTINEAIIKLHDQITPGGLKETVSGKHLSPRGKKHYKRRSNKDVGSI